jgi:hypothetical protein
VVSTQGGLYLSSALNPTSGGWATFDIDNVDLHAGKYYTTMLSWNIPGIPNQNQVFWVEWRDGGTYANGRTWVSTNGVDYVSQDLDLAFCVQMVPSLESKIVSVEPFSANVLEVAVDTQSPSTAYLKGIADLVYGDWTNVLQSIDGNDPFTETNLSYSATDTNGYRVIYVKSDEATQFYKVEVTYPE